ncbi:MAG TPA: class I SAM-dependent methyltransferase [Candidatus Baltobacteraceae bacterium]|nr:class I SAM-dependent methyltransferase [Candidatus Baltobacteraceae bacterium]
MTSDPRASFKEAQREGWQHFTPLELFTTGSAAELVAFAGVRAGDRVLDVGCGTGVVAITAARLGARVTALDLTPALIERGHEHARVAGVNVEWVVGDAEALPFEDRSFDVVLSQFGHMFAPRPDVAAAELLRVLERGGTLAFSTWPPDLLVGQMLRHVARYAPPPPPGVASPLLWGDVETIKERLGDRVDDIAFERATMAVSALSVPHYRATMERGLGMLRKIVETLSETDPERLAVMRGELDDLVARYYEKNVVAQTFLMTRSAKR